MVRFVKRAQQLGFNLDEIETLLDLAQGGPDSCGGAQRLAMDKISDLDQRIAHLRAIRESLQQLVITCERPRRERECPLLQSIEDTARRDGEQQNVNR